jgi:hypothetical protein
MSAEGWKQCSMSSARQCAGCATGAWVRTGGAFGGRGNGKASGRGGRLTAVQGKDGYQVERLARHSACGTEASARLTDAGAGYEVYEIECAANERRTYRCEFGNCARVERK